MKKTIVFLLIIFVLVVKTEAQLKLPALLSSNMVLQRNTEVNLWGESAPHSKVTISTSWDNKEYFVKSDHQGKWRTKVNTVDAGGPYKIIFKVDDESIALDNVLLGEVWIVSGQSNMEMPMGGFMYQPIDNSLDNIIESNQYPNIRLFTVPIKSSEKPLYDCESEWHVSSPKSVTNFSAVGYFFGKTISKVLNIPIGLISSTWGGSNIESWMTYSSLDSIKGIDHDFAKSGKSENSIPERLFNGMIVPISNFTARGFIWYQGESNRKNWYDYKELQIALVKLWRKSWKNPNMPFYITQLAPYNYEGKDLRSLPLVIEAQYKAIEEIPYSGIAATTDLGNPTCIHPQKKQDIGQRLAFLALKNDYGVEGLPAPAPTFKSFVRDGKKMILSFNNVSKEYDWNNPNSFKGYSDDGYIKPKGFEIAGSDGIYYPAESNYQWWKNTIEVWSDSIDNPVAVRYAFKNYCRDANVVTLLGQPLAPFRTDSWEVKDIGEIK
ncbi:MAG: sialate O-acetylesterase [Tissierellia bacterium]|jgi:sialate O-acetylesterase|nr:sialate O-acetylesterase [Tissierellia bacterium]